MLVNYVKIALRNIRRFKAYAFINLSGLVVGMSVTALILLWVGDELSFDRFHTHHARIHRVGVDLEAGTHMILVLSMPALSVVARDEIPEIENTARISRPVRAPVKVKDQETYENLVCYADGSLFDIFSFPFLAGNREQALEAPYTAVITQAMADKYFPSEDPLGKVIQIDGDRDYVVNGVLADVPANSHFRFHIVRSFETLYAEDRAVMENWLNIQYYTYFLLSEGADSAAVERRLPAVVDKYLGEALSAMGGTLVLFLQPLTRIHLYSRIRGEIAPQGDITSIYLFTVIALFILTLACINFVNLSTARSATRAQEIAVRKTLGSSRSWLIYQFLGESLFFSLAAFVMSAAIVSTALPWFENLIGRRLSVGILNSPEVMCGSLGLAVLVGLLAGAYPAAHLSGFLPSQALQFVHRGGTSRSRFRNILVVFQFSVSIGLIIGTLTTYRQIRYMKNKDLGFSQKSVLILPEIHRLLSRMSYANVRDEWLNIPGVLDVGGSALVPTRGVQLDIFYPEGFTRAQPQKLTRLDIEPHYLTTMDIRVIAGRNFARDLSTDPSESVLINESLARQFGWNNPLGKTFTFYSGAAAEGEIRVKKVVGVVEDFHFTSLHHRIEPVVMVYAPERIRFLSLKISSENIPQTIGFLQKKWKDLALERPFDYFFLDAAFDSQYRGEQRLGRISLYFSLLAVAIGCLGLFGFAAFMAERRTKEIGIRKVMGASSVRIVRLLTLDFLWLILAANALAWPTAAIALSLWLRRFSYRIGVSFLVMLTAGMLALTAALLTVSLLAVRAARANPVDALRTE